MLDPFVFDLASGRMVITYQTYRPKVGADRLKALAFNGEQDHAEKGTIR
jgi:hypothetical protein